MNTENNSDTEINKEDQDMTLFKTLLKKHTNIAILTTLIIVIFFIIEIDHYLPPNYHCIKEISGRVFGKFIT